MNRALNKTELNAYASPNRADARGKTCIVTSEINGPILNGGVGTANWSLALVLRKLGYEVDVLYTRVIYGKPVCDRGNFEEYVRAFQKVGIRLMCIDHRGWYDYLAMSYLSMQHLLREFYDIVFFDDMWGNGYYPLLARQTGNAMLRATTMCVTTHSTTQWMAEHGPVRIYTPDDLFCIEAERRSIELADVVKAPSAYILREYRRFGWEIPENSVVLPNFVSESKPDVQSSNPIAVKEIVFFGRLESRKGLWLFCRAIDKLKYKLRDYQITFLGKSVFEDGVWTAEALLKRSAQWPFSIRLLTDFDRDQALDYLKRDGRLAVMPSLEDNSPCAILECLQQGIPFLACSGSGGEELVHQESRSSNLFEPSLESLSGKLMTALSDGAVPGRTAVDHAHLEEEFQEWLARLPDPELRHAKLQPDDATEPAPILMVVIPSEFNSDSATAELERTAAAFQGKIELEILAAKPLELRNRLASSSFSWHVSDITEFGLIAESLAGRPSTVLGLCHISQLIPPNWIERARTCFAQELGIAALTGMIATPVPPKDHIDLRDTYFSLPDRNVEIERFLIGNSPALFPLAQGSNGGFLLMRSELIVGSKNQSPVSERYDRLKRMEDWIHEILVTLHISGKRFEVVPDLTMDKPVKEPQFEVFLLGDSMRQLAQDLYKYEPGTDQKLLTVLSIDDAIDKERSRGNAKYLSAIGEKINQSIPQLPASATWEQQGQQLAAIAFASGQIELAVDLCAEFIANEKLSRISSSTEYLKFAVNAVNLTKIDAKNYKILDLGDGSRIRVFSDAAQIEMRARSSAQNLTAIMFPRLDLSKITHFRGGIAVPEQATDPVRFFVELASEDRAHRWSANKELQKGEALDWEFELPPLIHGKYTALLGVDLPPLINDALTEVTVLWTAPQFVRRV